MPRTKKKSKPPPEPQECKKCGRLLEGKLCYRCDSIHGVPFRTPNRVANGRTVMAAFYNSNCGD